MQGKEGELPAAVVLYVERLAQVTFARENIVVGHVSAPHRLAQLSRNVNVFKSNERVAYADRGRRGCRLNDQVAHTDEDDEDQAAGQDEDEQRVAQTLILPEAHGPLVVEQLSEFCVQVVRTRV
jgi:hypothetical protein